MHRIRHIFILPVLFLLMVSVTEAQEMKDEFKRKLRQSFLTSGMEPSKQMHQPSQRHFHKRDEVLRVSPTTKLPTRLDRILKIGKMKEEEIQIDLNVAKR